MVVKVRIKVKDCTALLSVYNTQYIRKGNFVSFVVWCTHLGKLVQEMEKRFKY